VFRLRNLIGMDWCSINHIIDCGLRRVVKLEALRTENNLVRVKMVHIHDYIKDSFLFKSKGFGKREECCRLSLSPIPFLVMFALLWYVFVVCSSKWMQIQGQT